METGTAHAAAGLMDHAHGSELLPAPAAFSWEHCPGRQDAHALLEAKRTGAGGIKARSHKKSGFFHAAAQGAITSHQAIYFSSQGEQLCESPRSWGREIWNIAMLEADCTFSFTDWLSLAQRSDKKIK